MVGRRDAAGLCQYRVAAHALACGVPKAQAMYHFWLEAHEVYATDYKKGALTFLETVPLCHACHSFIHAGRMEILVDHGEMTRQRMTFIFEAGPRYSAPAGLAKTDPPTDSAPWGKWRMIVDGKKYRGKFKTFDDWAAHYAVDVSSPNWIDQLMNALTDEPEVA